MLDGIFLLIGIFSSVSYYFTYLWFKNDIEEFHFRYLGKHPWPSWFSAVSNFGCVWLFKRVDFRRILADNPRNKELPQEIRYLKRLKMWARGLFALMLIAVLYLIFSRR